MTEDIIDLREYLEFLSKHKKVFAAVLIVILVIMIVLNWFVIQPTYRGVGIISIAQINNNPIMKFRDAQSLILSDAFIKNLSVELKVEEDKIKSGLTILNSSSTSTDAKIIVLSFDFKDRNLISDFFDLLLTKLNAYLKDTYDNQLNSFKDRLEKAQEQLNFFSERETELLSELNNMRQEKNSNSEILLDYNLLQSTYNSVVVTKTGFIREISDLNSIINNSTPFYYQVEPVILGNPVSPRKILNIVIVELASFLALTAFFFFWKIYLNLKKTSA